MSRRFKDPSYRLHKQSGQAVVTLPDGLGGRRDVLWGKFDTPESRDQDYRVLAEWQANGCRLPVRQNRPGGLSLHELILAYYRHAEAYYVKDGKPTSEVETVKQAMRFVKRLYGDASARDFGPLCLKAVRQAMVEHDVTRTVKVKDPETGEVKKEVRVLRHGLARRYINKQVSRIKRIFAWAVEEELVPVEVYQALACVKGLKTGVRVSPGSKGSPTRPRRSSCATWNRRARSTPGPRTCRTGRFYMVPATPGILAAGQALV